MVLVHGQIVQSLQRRFRKFDALLKLLWLDTALGFEITTNNRSFSNDPLGLIGVSILEEIKELSERAWEASSNL